MYWEPPLYLAMAVDAVADTQAVFMGRRRGFERPLEPSPLYYGSLVLVALSLVFLRIYEPFMDAVQPLLLAVLGLLAASRLARRVAPVEVLASSLGLFSLGLVASNVAAGAVTYDPRGRLVVPLVLAVLGLASGIAAGAAARVEPGRRPVAAAAVAALGLAVLGLWFLVDTRLGMLLFGDALCFAALGIIVASSTAAVSRGAVRAAALFLAVVAAAVMWVKVYSGGVPYVTCVGACSLFGWALGVYLILVVVPRLYAEVTEKGMPGDLFEAALSPDGLVLAATVVLVVAAASAAKPFTSMDVFYVPVATLLAAAAAGGGWGVFAATVLASAAGWAAAGVWAAVAAASALGAAAYAAARAGVLARFLPRPGIAWAAALLVALLAASYTAVGWRSVEAETLVKPVGLGAPGEVAKPSQEVVHDYFLLYLGAKNESLLYALMAPKIGAKEALEMARFAHAIRLAAEKRGIKDPYDIKDLPAVERMPSLLVELEKLGVKVALPPFAVLSGHPYGSNTTVEGLSLYRVEVPGNTTKLLGETYLAMVSDPKLTDGDALRYAIYASLCLSWERTGTLNQTAKLLLSALAGELKPGSVEGKVVAEELPLGLLAAAVYVAALLASSLAPMFSSAEKVRR